MLVAAIALPLRAQSSRGGAPRLGTISFPATGLPAAQRDFLTGVLYLHSFEYESAAQAFVRAQRIDPAFVMAYWGEAMTRTHPVWNQQDIASAKAALERLAAGAAARAARAATPRERDYLAAVEALYGAGSKERRDTLYAEAMERVVRAYPEDAEAKAFYSLALLGLNQGVRDTVTYLRAAPYADTVFRANRDHPGAAHYLIHAYDDPIHAGLGLEAARAYSRIAPDAAHAQHMTTHIFLALGMWDEVVSQNTIAFDLSEGKSWHYGSWLAYGLIQQGRYDAARIQIERMRANLTASSPRPQYAVMGDMRAHYLLHVEEWRGAIYERRPSASQTTISGQVTDLFTAGAIAYRRRNASAVSAAAGEIARLIEAMRVDFGEHDANTVVARIMARTLGGMFLFLGGNQEPAIRALREAAALSDALPMEFGPPAIVEPPREVLGTMLLEIEPALAKVEFEKALAQAPGRSRALIGLVRASVAIGDKASARKGIDQLVANWRQADHQVRDAIGPLRRLVDRM